MDDNDLESEAFKTCRCGFRKPLPSLLPVTQRLHPSRDRFSRPLCPTDTVSQSVRKHHMASSWGISPPSPHSLMCRPTCVTWSEEDKVLKYLPSTHTTNWAKMWEIIFTKVFQIMEIPSVSNESKHNKDSGTESTVGGKSPPGGTLPLPSPVLQLFRRCDSAPPTYGKLCKMLSKELKAETPEP
jgi:hypothetical protein